MATCSYCLAPLPAPAIQQLTLFTLDTAKRRKPTLCPRCKDFFRKLYQHRAQAQAERRSLENAYAYDD
jgi:hypothetical protein